VTGARRTYKGNSLAWTIECKDQCVGAIDELVKVHLVQLEKARWYAHRQSTADDRAYEYEHECSSNETERWRHMTAAREERHVITRCRCVSV